MKVDLQNKSFIKYNRPKLHASSLGIGALNNISQTIINLMSTGLSYCLGKGMDAHSVGISDFINCIIENKPFTVTGESGRETVRVMEMLVAKLGETSRNELLVK